MEKGLVQQSVGRSDRRQRLLTLTEQGAALERALFERQRERLIEAYREAGGPAVEGFRRVLRGVMGTPARATLDAKADAPQPAARPRMV
jgi:DNA-binding MarR family transcriptional regulator